MTDQAAAAARVVGVFEATGDINTALDEEFSSSAGGVDFALLANAVRQILHQTSQPTPPASQQVLDESIALLRELQLVGDRAAQCERDCAMRLELWTNKGVKQKEAKLQALEALHDGVKQWSSARQLVALVGDLALPLHTRVEHFIQLLLMCQHNHRPSSSLLNSKTQFATWYSRKVDFYQLKLQLQLQDEARALSKRAASKLYQDAAARQHQPQSLLGQLAKSVGLCVQLQLASTTTATAAASKADDDESAAVVVIINGEMVSPNAWGIDIYASFTLMRFQYNFGTTTQEARERATSRVDRPEWFVGFVLESIRDRASFLTQHVQPSCQLSPSSSAGVVMIDALSHFIRALVVRGVHVRLSAVWPQLADNVALLSHTIDELLVGDRALKDEFAYARTAAQHWPLMLSFLVQSEARMDKWMSADLHFARTRLRQNILASPSAWKGGRGGGKQAECAASVVSLVEMLGERIGAVEGGEGWRAKYAEHVQGELLSEFVGLCQARSSPAERFNSLLPLQDALVEWEVRGEEGGEGEFALGSLVDVVRGALRAELEREVQRVFASVAGELKSWERRSWSSNSASGATAGGVNRAVDVCRASLQEWTDRVNDVSCRKLVRMLGHQLESYLVEFVRQRRFGAAGAADALTSDAMQFVRVFTSAGGGVGALLLFGKLRVLLRLLTKYSKDELASGAWGGEVFEEEEEEDSGKTLRTSWDQLGITPHELARIKS